MRAILLHGVLAFALIGCTPLDIFNATPRNQEILAADAKMSADAWQAGRTDGFEHWKDAGNEAGKNIEDGKLLYAALYMLSRDTNETALISSRDIGDRVYALLRDADFAEAINQRVAGAIDVPINMEADIASGTGRNALLAYIRGYLAGQRIALRFSNKEELMKFLKRAKEKLEDDTDSSGNIQSGEGGGGSNKQDSQQDNDSR
jgi:hypothetical protein